VSINGIHPMDWLLDNTGPMARTVTDAAIALTVMAGEDPKDFRTRGSVAKAQAGPYDQYLKKDALKGRRFGVPAFIMNDPSLRPETRAMFMKAIDALRSAGGTVVSDELIMPAGFEDLIEAINTRPYLREGLERFLQDFGPMQYHSSAEYARTIGMPLPLFFANAPQRNPETDPGAESLFFGPQRRALASYQETLDRFRLDGFVYPALQMPPNDETTMPRSDGVRF